MALNIKTGAVREDIVRDGETVGVFVFSPTDFSWLERFYALENSLTALEKKSKLLKGKKDQRQLVKETMKELRSLRAGLENLFGKENMQAVLGDGFDFVTFASFCEGITQIINEQQMSTALKKYIAADALEDGFV